MRSLSLNPENSRHRKVVVGFSMVEILAVMAVLAVVAAVASPLFFSGTAPGLRMQAAVADAGALFNQARALAQARGTAARVLVSRDAENPKQNGRYMVVVAMQRGSGDEPMTWQPVGNGVYLPDGIRHVPLQEAPTFWDPVSRQLDEKSGKPWTSYHFGSSGRGGGGPFLLSSKVQSADGAVKLIEDTTIDGFLIRSNGYLTYFDGTDQVKQFLEQLEQPKQ